MNSSDIIEDSEDESIMYKHASLSVSDCSVDESIILRPSFEGVVDESFQNTSNMDSNKHLLQERKNGDHLSSDEDDNFVSVARSARRVRRIASDSEDELEHVESPTRNCSFTNHRSVEILDLEEDNDEDSATSSTETSNSSNFEEINKSNEIDDEDELKHVELPATNCNLTNHRSVKILNSEEDNDEDSATETWDSSNFKEINKSKEMDDELSSSSHSSFSLQNKSSGLNINENFNDDKENTSINESCRPKVEDKSSDQSDAVISILSSDNEDNSVSVVEKPNIGNRPKLFQTSINTMVQNMSLNGAGHTNNTQCNTYCTAAEYANQTSKVSNLRTDILRCKHILRTVNLSSLPDNGTQLNQRHKNLEKLLSIEEEKLKKMSVNYVEPSKPQKTTWEQLQTNAAYVVPNTFGKQAMNTYAAQKTLTMDRLKNLHDSLAMCPGEDTLAEDPKGLKVELMRHQKRALAWLVWREAQKPSGGILADDMGLGKTLTMISLILATKETELEDNDSESESEEKSCSKWTSRNNKYKLDGGTLVICPATLIRQWESEIDNRLKRNLLCTELYHGTSRETNATRLAKYDVVITTYKLVQGEFKKKGPLYKIKWKRIILDEGHVIRNPKAQTSVAICDLKAKARWVLTGTPVHNTELDLYALLKFLRCSPFDDLAIWKRWVANKNAGGQDRLNTVITSILLRRTKAQLQTQGALQSLPEKKFEVIEVSLDNAEKKIYEKVLVFSRTLFIQFLRQRAERNHEFSNIKGGDLTQTNDEEYNKMHKKIMQMHGNTEVKSHEILVLLLRLRQICCHPSLISSMLDQEDCAAEGIEDGGVDIELLDKLDNLNLDDETENPTPAGEKASFTTQANKVLSSSNPVFAEQRANEKLRVIQKIIEEKVLTNDDKIIIVSQWTSMLNVIMRHLKGLKIKCDILDGKVPVNKRNDIVVDFNNPNSKTKVLLLSLTAGGVGLNLVGANHLLLVDLHWNPQLESQAQDRIYRVGQKKTVFIYKIVTIETIEEKIKALQDNKLSMASDILSGVRPGAGSKLSLDDLKMLFNVAG